MIPSFGLGNVLPPFEGSDVTGQFNSPRSPYEATMSELFERFGTSAERAHILRGFKSYRDSLRKLGFEKGFQWVDGSFVEACEIIKGRPPSDIDVVSLLYRPKEMKSSDKWKGFVQTHSSTILDSAYCKNAFQCDAYSIDLDIDADLVASQTAYWFSLFSHQRDTFRWKGLIQIEINCDDNAAIDLLTKRETSW